MDDGAQQERPVRGFRRSLEIGLAFQCGDVELH